MSRFKEFVATDISQTFINGDEFAEPHNINGVDDIMCVIDDDIIQERSSYSYSEYAEGVFQSQKMVFVSVADLPERPVKGELFRLDGELYQVFECVENNGMLEITIQANDT